MTAGSWIYIGTQGIVQGTYETFAEMGGSISAAIYRASWIFTAGLGGMGGAQPLAATHGRRVVSGNRMPASRASRCACARGYLDRAGGQSRRSARHHRATPRKEARCRWACSATPPKCCRRSCDAACVLMQSRIRPSAHDPLQRLCAAGWIARTVAMRRADRSGRLRERRASSRWQSTCEAMLDFQRMGMPVVRLRQQHPPDGDRGRRDRRIRFSRLRAGLHPSALLPRQRSVPLGRRCRATRKTSTAPMPK